MDLAYEEEIAGYSERLRLYNAGLYDQFKEILIPVNAGWTTALVGSGSVFLSPTFLNLATGVTASSSAIARATLFNLTAGNLIMTYTDWYKRLELECVIGRLNSDAQAVARLQIKSATTEGILAGKGIGLQISNYALVGESYGTARGTLALATMTDNRAYHVRIVVVPSKLVEFWLNRAKIGELTGTAVPTASSGADLNILASIINGAAGGVDAQVYISPILLAQAWGS